MPAAATKGDLAVRARTWWRAHQAAVCDTSEPWAARHGPAREPPSHLLQLQPGARRGGAGDGCRGACGIRGPRAGRAGAPPDRLRADRARPGTAGRIRADGVEMRRRSSGCTTPTRAPSSPTRASTSSRRRTRPPMRCACPGSSRTSATTPTTSRSATAPRRWRWRETCVCSSSATAPRRSPSRRSSAWTARPRSPRSTCIPSTAAVGGAQR